MKNLDPKRARWIRIRMGILCGLMACGLGAIVSGAYRIEVEDGKDWYELAERQRQRRLHITPKRGTVYDRNGAPLAESVEVPSVSLDAVEMLRGIEERYVPMRSQQYAERIAQVLALPVEEVAEKIGRRRRFAWLKRRISEQEAEGIRGLSERTQRHPIRGLVIEGEGRRFYPNRELAGPLLGFVAPDGLGKEGLELSLEHELRGEASEVKGLRDRSGRLIFADSVENEQSLAGHNVHLTIDKAIQFTAERELAAAMRTYEALGGSIVVVEPSTGEVLAMASAPGYNPNDYSSSDPDARRNRCVVDRFEPGSTMKVFTMAAAIASKSISPTATLYCEEGNMPIDNVVIHDTHPAKWLTPTQILSLSSNIGMAKIGLGLGEQRLYEGYRRFGFGDVTGLPVPGESSGVLRPRGRPWVQVETASAAFGQGISVTSLQLAMAMAAVANQGRLMEPVLVKRVTDSTGLPLFEAAPKVRRDTVPAHVARLVSEMLVAVTEGEGTGIEAAIPGFRVAGKTATAQKIDPATGRYTDTHYVASFVGFIPNDRPRLTIAVVLDEPMGGTYAGGSVAGPVFRRVGEMSLRYLGVTPRGNTPMKLSEVAEQAGGDIAESTYQALGKGRAGEAPAPSAAPPPAAPVRIGEVRVPDLTGLPARAALKSVTELGLSASIEGTGRIARQEPAPGSVLSKGAAVKLFFEPPS
ncbi:penicillin-binding protein [Chondromyces apiculatus]|uniref:Cell division protein FtsI /Peptidoglycan synthetase n=1 Tax=Chondromyces apiculatus DSM 436 TaxID=1192034 RepID=A0A017T1E3_9BACT|nr:penicillin-binding protein [Chondromyces apiculatus]EYF02391.1 Cell division protein FtsI /Peptidoglycan synthetase [Chondromyces apiculatus DSM 436]